MNILTQLRSCLNQRRTAPRALQSVLGAGMTLMADTPQQPAPGLEPLEGVPGTDQLSRPGLLPGLSSFPGASSSPAVANTGTPVENSTAAAAAAAAAAGAILISNSPATLQAAEVEVDACTMAGMGQLASAAGVPVNSLQQLQSVMAAPVSVGVPVVTSAGQPLSIPAAGVLPVTAAPSLQAMPAVSGAQQPAAVLPSAVPVATLPITSQATSATVRLTGRGVRH